MSEIPDANKMSLVAGRTDALAFVSNPDPMALQSVLAEGDISKLTVPQRLQFIAAVTRSLGLNPLTQPFDFITLNGKMRMYAKKDATDQLRKIHSVSLRIVKREIADGLLIVTAQAKLPDGREDESIGALNIGSLSGEAKANALMKCETKAKRRVTLSICGLGFLDESEIEGAKSRPEATGAVHDPWAPIPDQESPADAPQSDALEMEPDPTEDATVWQELYPKGWERWVTGRGWDADDARGLLKLWNDNRADAGLCAHGAIWLSRNIPAVEQLTWDELQQDVEELPDLITDCTPQQLFACVRIVAKKIKAQEGAL